MFMFIFLLLMMIIFIALTPTAMCTGGTMLIVVCLGSIITCIFIMGWIVNYLTKDKNKKGM